MLKFTNMKNNQLFNGTLIFFVIIIGALLISAINKNYKGYKISNNEFINHFSSPDIVINFKELNKILQTKSDDFLIVDIRDENVFKTINIPGSINIIPEKAFEKETIKFLKKLNKNILITSNSQEQAAIYAAYYTTIGIKGLKVISGSPDIYIQHKNNPSYSFYNSEKQSFSYKNFIKLEEKEEPRDLNPVMQRAKGGC
jgi:rhodanese-related sulfurtransferase